MMTEGIYYSPIDHSKMQSLLGYSTMPYRGHLLEGFFHFSYPLLLAQSNHRYMSFWANAELTPEAQVELLNAASSDKNLPTI